MRVWSEDIARNRASTPFHFREDRIFRQKLRKLRLFRPKNRFERNVATPDAPGKEKGRGRAQRCSPAGGGLGFRHGTEVGGQRSEVGERGMMAGGHGGDRGRRTAGGKRREGKRRR